MIQISISIPSSTLEKFTTFGDLLRFLRRRVGLTQTELAIAVGYGHTQISRLEQNLRLPDIPTIEARFVPALGLEDEPKVVARLIGWADAPREEISDSRPSLEQADVDKIIAACLTKMGEAEYSDAYEEGKKMSLDEAVAFALQE